MAKVKVYYEHFYESDRLAPIWYVINFGFTKIDWSKKTMYVPLNAPFERQNMEDFSDVVMGVSIEISDLTLNPERPKSFGIHLPLVKERIEKLGYESFEVEQFIIQVRDIEEVMQLKDLFDGF